MSKNTYTCKSNGVFLCLKDITHVSPIIEPPTNYSYPYFRVYFLGGSSAVVKSEKRENVVFDRDIILNLLSN